MIFSVGGAVVLLLITRANFFEATETLYNLELGGDGCSCCITPPHFSSDRLLNLLLVRRRLLVLENHLMKIIKLLLLSDVYRSALLLLGSRIILRPLELRFSVSVVAVRSERARLALGVETTHYRLVLARVGSRQPSRGCF